MMKLLTWLLNLHYPEEHGRNSRRWAPDNRLPVDYVPVSFDRK